MIISNLVKTNYLPYLTHELDWQTLLIVFLLDSIMTNIPIMAAITINVKNTTINFMKPTLGLLRILFQKAIRNCF